MAQIDIQKKEGPPVLPILLGLLAIAAVIAIVWYFARGDDDDSRDAMPYDTVATATATRTDDAAPAEIRQYREQCADASQFRDDMGVEHEHEADCMRRLANGIDAVVRRETVADQPLQQRVESLKQRAEQITADPQATDHASRVRSAADEAAQIIEYIAQNRSAAGANLQQHAQQARAAANQIDGGTLLLEQRDRTSAFFSRAADALDAMVRGDGTQTQPR